MKVARKLPRKSLYVFPKPALVNSPPGNTGSKASIPNQSPALSMKPKTTPEPIPTKIDLTLGFTKSKNCIIVCGFIPLSALVLLFTASAM